MTEETSLIGQVCVCSQGRPGIVIGRQDLPQGTSWVGIGLDHGTLWSSRNPTVLRAATHEDLMTALSLAHQRFVDSKIYAAHDMWMDV